MLKVQTGDCRESWAPVHGKPVGPTWQWGTCRWDTHPVSTPPAVTRQSDAAGRSPPERQSSGASLLRASASIWAGKKSTRDQPWHRVLNGVLHTHGSTSLLFGGLLSVYLGFLTVSYG